MLIDEIRFLLKDGREAVIRSPREEDVPGTLEYLYKTAGETPYLLRTPEECVKYTYEGEKALFEQINRSDNQAMPVCLVDGRVVGNCQILWKTSLKTRHRATVAIAILKEFWGQGIGTKMFETLFRIAENNPNLLQLELDFIEGNVCARALYEKMGFRICGVRPDAIRMPDGTLLNEYSMIRKIPRS